MLLRAALVGAILFVATPVVHGQSVRDTVGPLEQSASPSSPENPIPRRLSAPRAARIQEWKQFTGLGLVRFQVTLDTTGRVGEIRKLLGPLVQQDSGRAIDAATQRAIADAIMKSAATSVSQWTYDPPRAPITFPVLFNFPAGAEPVATQDPRPTPSGRGSGSAAPPWPAADGAVRIGGNIRPPVQTRKATPVYPRDAQADRVSGAVFLEILIGTNGKVKDARVLRSVPLLDTAAIEAVRKWEYEPTLVNGMPVPVVMQVTVTFTLK